MNRPILTISTKPDKYVNDQPKMIRQMERTTMEVQDANQKHNQIHRRSILKQPQMIEDQL
jgi:hypothetical protein